MTGTQPTLERHCDVAVIGGSAAGLAAALQLARQRRSVIVVDDGTPRNAPAAHMHGYLGLEGAAPSDLIDAGREEVRRYGGELLTGRVLGVRRADEGGFRLELTGGHTLLGRRVLAATGIADILPNIEGLAGHWGHGAINCPFCHGFEVRGRQLVQIVTHPMGLHQTAVWRHLAGHLTVVLHHADGVDPDALDALEAAGVAVTDHPVRRILSSTDGALSGVELADGSVLAADAVVIGPRFRARADMLAEAGVVTAAHPSGLGDMVETDPITGETAVRGMFAAGNVTDPSLQVLPSAAHGSRVAAMIAFGLAEDDLRGGVPTSGERADWEHRYGAVDAVWSSNPNGTLVNQVENMAPGRALDIGAGEGADALWLAERGWQVSAADISGNALSRIGAEAERRGLTVHCLQGDVTDAGAFGTDTYDLVSLQYGSFHRSPDRHGLMNLLDAVASGGTLLVVGHEQSWLDEPIDVGAQTRMYDPSAYVGVAEIAAALKQSDSWRIEVLETLPRPAGAASTQHSKDVLLRAIRR